MDSITEQFFDDAFGKTVELGNKLAEKHDNADLWDIADGLLAGAIQYWLYARQPCGNPRCEESEYYHSPSDSNVGRA
jgi:hypothetical protein